MNEKRLLILAALLVVALIGMIGVQAYHLQQLNTQLQHLQVAQTPSVGQVTFQAPSNPDPYPAPSGSKSPAIEDLWSLSGIGSEDWNPFEEIQRMQAQMDRMFSSTLNQFQASPNFGSIASDPYFLPELDLKDEGERYVATLDLPGLDQSRVDIRVEGQALTVSGERDATKKDEDANGKVIRQERSVGKFERRVPLPGPVDQDKVEANYENGVLTITLPKAEEDTTARKIPLNSGPTPPTS